MELQPVHDVWCNLVGYGTLSHCSVYHCIMSGFVQVAHSVVCSFAHTQIIQDVAAVAALMSSLGAPPRLQMHIGGESMLNDGSSFVFYTIFSAMFLTELGIDGLGETMNLRQGIAIFFREGFGAAAYGIAFGLGLTFFLYKLDRKLDDSENVVQIVAMITVAYLAYYTADISGCSGVISVVATGITAKAYGYSMLNDNKLREQFWAIVEQLVSSYSLVFWQIRSRSYYSPHCLAFSSIRFSLRWPAVSAVSHYSQSTSYTVVHDYFSLIYSFRCLFS
jgi:NhaP-type Na+/H+ or K+/H+ antiporter